MSAITDHRVASESGYGSGLYARSLAAFGDPRELTESGGWILERGIPGVGSRDGFGVYPLFTCRDWSGLSADFAGLADRLVTVTVVADPFGPASEEDLLRWFDVVMTVKSRFVVDLERIGSHPPSPHHRKRAERAYRRVTVESHEEGMPFLDEWMELYSHLVRRHSLSGIPAFSREAFRIQLTVPGLVLFRASMAGRAVGMHLWYRRDEVAYSHLTALDPLGYRVGASFALHDAAIRHFARRVGWLDLGGGAGIRVAAGDGLAAFKSGWSNEERPTFLCGRVLNPPLYDELRRTASPMADYFPIYRAGEHSRFFGSRFSREAPELCSRPA